MPGGRESEDTVDMPINLANSLMEDVVLLEAAPGTEVALSLLVIERHSVASVTADVAPSCVYSRGFCPSHVQFTLGAQHQPLGLIANATHPGVT